MEGNNPDNKVLKKYAQEVLKRISKFKFVRYY